ncbi:MAG: hypothetical protein B7Y36_08290 [Novosphingobium sp. 28-62-57]|nr:MAG: hypothetical protein B7Y36_08290 [Novosphingobium sp. 28-62-57]OZA36955.1 MAG: hypothetical protein B7X92_05425 [Novosphingobium sp. 17-62-9]
MHEGARACREFVKSATLQPDQYIDLEQWVNGCRTVAVRLHSQPAWQGLQDQGLRGVQSNILVGGYRCTVPDGLASGVKGARGGESFGDFRPGAALGGAVDRGEIEQLGACGENGGILRVCGGASGLVGRPMLEGLAQSVGFAGLSDLGHKPVRLTQGAAWAASMGGVAIGPRHPPCPQRHRARPLAPSRPRFFQFGTGIRA